MPLQTKNNCSGNGARRRVINNRVWAFRNEIAAELAPPVEDKLEEIQAPRVRQANRRATDSKGLRGGGSDATFFHPELGKPQPGVRMVSVYRKNDGLEAEIGE